MTTPEQARDEMLAVFKAAWDPTGYTAIWSDIPGTVPASEAPWARVTVRHQDGRQGSLSNQAGVTRHTYTGTLFVQLFVPVGQGLTLGYTLARLVVQAYRTARGAVWYRRQQFREAGNSGAFEQINVTVEFTYDDA